MKTKTLKKYTLLTIDDNDDFIDFYIDLKKDYQTLKKQHLIINILKEKSLSKEHILLLLEATTAHKTNNYSFIIINTAIDIDRIPETLNIVPTLQEAEDLLEMETIERELGF